MTDTFRRLIRLAKPFRWWILLSAMLGFLTVGSSIGLLMTSAFILAKAALHSSIAELQVAIVGVRFFGLSRGVFRYLERYTGHEVTFRLLSRLRLVVYKALLPLAPAGIAGYRYGDLLERTTRDIDELQNFYTRILAPPIIALLVTLLMWILLSVYYWLVPLILTGALFSAGWLLPMFTGIGARKEKEQLAHFHGERTSILTDQALGLGEILAYSMEDAEYLRIKEISEKINRIEDRVDFSERFGSSAIIWIMQMTLLSVIVVLVPEIAANQVSGIGLAVILLGIMAAFEAAGPVATGADRKSAVYSAGERMFGISDVVPARSEEHTVSLRPGAPDKIIFTDVSFGYEPGRSILNNLNLTFSRGKVYVIVGASGSGKTTIHQLLCGFHRPLKGAIMFDGVNSAHFPVENMVRHIGVMEQNPAFFSATILENLHMGAERLNRQMFEQALTLVGMQEMVMRLPDRLRTKVGPGGKNISGGERQRLAAARTFLDARPVMIFDEPTSNLNPELGWKILDAIYGLRTGHIVLIITHRLYHLEQADEILVLENGRISESGTHDELISKKGDYYSMWNSRHDEIIDNS